MKKATQHEKNRILRNIKKMRELRGYKQLHVANQLGVVQTTYSKIENGEIELSDEYFEKIAVALDTTTEAIENADLERMVFHIQHQEGHSGSISIYNAVDETLKGFEKAFEKYTQPYKDQIKRLEEEVIFLRKLGEGKK